MLSESHHSRLSTTRISLPQAVQQLLTDVRVRLRRDAMVSGILLLICLAGIVFWVTTGIDLGWFAIQKLELPVGLRAIFLSVLLPGTMWVLGSRIVFPLVRTVRDIDLAVLLERRFPQFQDRLIISVEAAGGYPLDGPLVADMLQRAAVEAGELTGSLSADEVFDVRSIRRLAVYAAIAVMSVTGFALVQPGSLQRWWNAFIRCDVSYYQRSTDLQVLVVAQPGDRRVEFRQRDNDRIYLHPRGADFEMEITVPEGGPREGVAWVVPDRIRVDVIRSDGSLSRTFVSPTSDRTWRFVMTRLQEPITIELLAGDYRSVQPWRIEPVSIPRLDAIKLECQYPEYTGWNQLRETQIEVTGSEVALPVWTEFRLNALSAKPLQSARIVSGEFELSGDRESSHVVGRRGVHAISTGRQPLISADGMTLSAVFQVIAAETGDAGDDGSSGETRQASVVDSSSSGLSAADPGDGALPVVSNTPLRFFLHDDDGVMSVNPEVLRIRGVEDKPPVIVARGVGIDNAVTRFARIPVTGTIRDDYGLASAGFQFLVDDESEWRPRPFHQLPQAGQTEFELRRSDDEPTEVFDVKPLDLSEGQTLTLAVAAVDGNSRPGPGMTRSEPMLFRIVSNEDLLSLLYTREITLRRRMEEVIAQLEQIREDLVFHREPADRLDSGDNSIILPQDRMGVSTCAARSGSNLRRQTNEIRSIVEGFDEIIQQLINNAIPPQQLAQNMRDEILNPLTDIADKPMADADRVLSEFGVAAQSGKKVRLLVDTSLERVELVISQLKVILENVRDLAEFHEALRDLKAILEDQQKLQEEIKALQKRNLIDKLKLLE